MATLKKDTNDDDDDRNHSDDHPNDDDDTNDTLPIPLRSLKSSQRRSSSTLPESTLPESAPLPQSPASPSTHPMWPLPLSLPIPHPSISRGRVGCVKGISATEPPLAFYERDLRRRTAYQLFVRLNFVRLRRPGEPMRDSSRRVAAEWRQLDPEQRQKYEDQLVADCLDLWNRLKSVARIHRRRTVISRTTNDNSNPNLDPLDLGPLASASSVPSASIAKSLKLVPHIRSHIQCYNLFVQDRLRSIGKPVDRAVMSVLSKEWQANKKTLREQYTKGLHEKALNSLHGRFDGERFRQRDALVIRPKQYPRAYNLFCAARFEAARKKQSLKDMPSITYREFFLHMSKVNSGLWRSMGDHEKRPYFEQAEERARDYHKALQAYEENASVTDRLVHLHQDVQQKLLTAWRRSGQRLRSSSSRLAASAATNTATATATATTTVITDATTVGATEPHGTPMENDGNQKRRPSMAMVKKSLKLGDRRRQTSAFSMYVRHRLQELRQERPGARLRDTMKQIGPEWKQMDVQRKQEFENLAQYHKVDYK